MEGADGLCETGWCVNGRRRGGESSNSGMRMRKKEQERESETATRMRGAIQTTRRLQNLVRTTTTTAAGSIQTGKEKGREGMRKKGGKNRENDEVEGWKRW
jgi:hypothetical protein